MRTARTATRSHGDADQDRRTGRGTVVTRVLLVGLGTVAAGYGAVGLLTDPMGPRLPGYLAFCAALVLGHDLVLAPLGLLAGLLVGRLVPAGARGVVRAGLLVSGVVALATLPFVAGIGYRASNPSALPLDYRRGLLVTLAAVWLGAALLLVLQALRRRRDR